MNEDNVYQFQKRSGLHRHFAQDNTSGSVWIDFLTFWQITLPLWWMRMWPGFFLLGVLTVSALFMVWVIVSGVVHINWSWLMSLVDFGHIYIRPQ